MAALLILLALAALVAIGLVISISQRTGEYSNPDATPEGLPQGSGDGLVCPRCDTLYRPGYLQCADCGVDLVAPAPPSEPVATGEDPAVGDMVRVFTGIDPNHIAFMKSLLGGNDIEYLVLGEHHHTIRHNMGVQFMVPKEQAAAAMALVEEFQRTGGVGSEAAGPATPQLARLSPFVGDWETEGEVLSEGAAPVRFTANDDYQWTAAGRFLLHRFEAAMPEGPVSGVELVGYDEKAGDYSLYAFDNAGGVSTMRARVDGGVWTFLGDTARFTGSFSDDHRQLTGLWERRDGAGRPWRAWMKVTLRKI